MKRILLLCLVFIWLVPGAALAHSKLETAEPGVNETIGASPETIQMTFDTNIEKISNFKLFNSLGEQVEIGNTAVEGSAMKAAVPNALDNGDYTVKWTIVGADGHLIEGEYAFTVDAPLAEETPPAETEAPAADSSGTTEEAPGEPAPEATGEPVSEPEAAPSPTAAPADSGSGRGNSGYAPFMIIGSIIVVVAALTAVLRRRKP